MNALTWSEFRKCLRDSGLVSEALVNEWLGNATDGDPRQAALVLVRARLLTEWQAKFLLSGRSRLRLGGYILLDRRSRDALGDHFVAKHESLDRQVDLLVLSSDHAAEPVCRQRFLVCASQLTQLDHPSLEHVYDVGQESDRFYVVSEFVEATPISDVAAGNQLRPFQRWQIVADLVSAARYAAAQELSLPGLRPQDFAFDVQGRGKIINLVAMSLNERILNEDYSSSLDLPVSTWQPLGNAIVDFLGSDPSPQARNVSRLALAAARGEADAIEQLEAIVTHAMNESISSTRLESKSTVSTTPRPSSNRTNERAPRPVGRRGLAAAAVAAIVVVAGLFFYWQSRNSGASVALRQPVDEGDRNAAGKNDQPSTQTVARSRLENSAAARRESEPDPFAVDPSSIGATNADGSDTEPSPDLESAASGSGNPAIVEISLASATHAARATANAVTSDQPSTLQDPVQRDKPDPFVIPSRGGVAGNAPPNSGSEAPSTSQASDGNPFAGWSSTAVLADSKHKQGQVLGSLPTGSVDQLRLDYSYDPESVGRGRLYFTLSPSLDQPRAWRVDMQLQSREQPAKPVAEIATADSQLTFRWLDDVDERSPANYFVNGVLKLTLGDQTHRLMLREPIVIPPLALEKDSLSGRSLFDVPWTPQNYRIEIGAFTAENGWELARRPLEEMVPKQPLMVQLRETPSEQLIWLQLQFDTRNRLSVTMDTMSPLSQRPLKLNELEQIAAGLQQRFLALVEFEAQAKIQADNAPYGQKTKTRQMADEAKSAANEGRRQRDVAVELKDTLDKLVGRQFPLRLVYLLDDQTIELARTSEFAPADDR